MKTNNQLVAEFMGLEWNSYERLKRNYESNWVELMSVVEAIEKISFNSHELYSVQIVDKSCEVIENPQYRWTLQENEEMPDIYFREQSKIKAVYKAVVIFIIWYNTKTIKP